MKMGKKVVRERKRERNDVVGGEGTNLNAPCNCAQSGGRELPVVRDQTVGRFNAEAGPVGHKGEGVVNVRARNEVGKECHEETRNGEPVGNGGSNTRLDLLVRGLCNRSKEGEA